MDTWLQSVYGVSGHDGGVSYHIPGSFKGTAERYCVADAFRYFCPFMTDGCEYRLY